MKTAAGAFILAIVLFLAGAVGLSEARLMRQVATEYMRLATLQYGRGDAVESAMTLVGRLSLPSSSTEAVETQRATASYWQARYQELTPLTGGTGDRPTTDPDMLLIAANAAFRASFPDAGNPKAAVDRLNGVMQAYGEVLRADPNNLDAAYNYEYVARFRDALARGRPPTRGGKDPKNVDLSGDLPAGPTLHGRPGGPPPESSGEFKTYMPMQRDERGEQIEVGRKPVPRRRG